MSFDLELKSRRALVTGGTKGIGAAVVNLLCDAGANVVAAARSVPNNSPHGLRYISADLSTLKVAPMSPSRFCGSSVGLTSSSTCWEVQARRVGALRSWTTMNGGKNWI